MITVLRRGTLLRTGWNLSAACVADQPTDADRWAIDLRADAELGRPASSAPGRLLRVPIDLPGVAERLAGRPSVGSYAALYRDLLHHRGPAVGAVLTAVAAHLPLGSVVGCSLGKDRTGVVVGLILAVLGVSTRDILLADSAAMAVAASCATAVRGYAGRHGVTEAEFHRRLRLGTPGIGIVLDEIVGRYGDVASYVRDVGVSARTLTSLRSGLLR